MPKRKCSKRRGFNHLAKKRSQRKQQNEEWKKKRGKKPTPSRIARIQAIKDGHKPTQHEPIAA